MFDTNNPFMRTVTSGPFLAGVVAGGLVTLLVTNPTLQRAVFRAAAKTAAAVKGGLAEVQERFNDAEAEIQMEAEEEQEELQATS